MDKTFIKRRYFEMRVGAVTINPIIAASTLIGVAYLYISEYLPMWLFVPIFVASMVVVTTVVGYKFRGIQLQTDEDMKYEKQRELNKSLFLILKILDDGSPEFKERMAKVKSIADLI